jgi:hypothetical protein
MFIILTSTSLDHTPQKKTSKDWQCQGLQRGRGCSCQQTTRPGAVEISVLEIHFVGWKKWFRHQECWFNWYCNGIWLLVWVWNPLNNVDMMRFRTNSMIWICLKIWHYPCMAKLLDKMTMELKVPQGIEIWDNPISKLARKPMLLASIPIG